MMLFPEAVAQEGFALIQDCRAPVDELLIAIASAAGASVRSKDRSVFAVRNLLSIPAIARWATSPSVRDLIEPILGPAAFAVRGILFDKTPTANWKVPWHQDLSIAVKQRVETPGFGPWSSKAGVPHVQPPQSVLEQMFTVRLHLDECGQDNGPLKVIPGSHRLGIMNEQQLSATVSAGPAAHCCVPCGGAVLMRPLLAHASSSAVVPGHRRVVHIEFSNGPLPLPLEWEDRSVRACLRSR